MENASRELLRALPQVEEVLKHDYMKAMLELVPHSIAADAVRSSIDGLRQRILNGETPVVTLQAVADASARAALALQRPSLRRVINASGVVIHTNLGRSVMAPEAVAAVNDAITGYSTLEYSINKMARGSRHDHYESLVCALTGAEAAIAVNNNAAAVLMVLAEFARGHEAIVSRGELVEIGGSFRIPSIMEMSNARMIDVGCTNKTHIEDYESVITPDTAMLLKVHPSNFLIQGFTETVSIQQLRALADAENAKREGEGEPIMVYEDQGSGAFEHLEESFGKRAESTVAQSLKAGADLVSFSGDKLLGGPQAGIICGRKELIDRLKKNPLARALRLDKMTIAALEATLRLYLGDDAKTRIPTLRMLTESAESVAERAEQLKSALLATVHPGKIAVDIVPETSRAGGGALPMYDIPTFCVEVRFLQGDAQSADEYLVKRCPVPIVARLSHERLLFDARTLLDNEEIEAIAQGVAAYFDRLGE